MVGGGSEEGLFECEEGLCGVGEDEFWDGD